MGLAVRRFVGSSPIASTRGQNYNVSADQQPCFVSGRSPTLWVPRMSSRPPIRTFTRAQWSAMVSFLDEEFVRLLE